MSRYRSEVHSLRARIRELTEQLEARDRAEGVGDHASTGFGRGMYHVGRLLGGAWRKVQQWRQGSVSSKTEAARLRLRMTALERALLERPSAPPPRWEE
ncbi:hypothetical protein [Chondromyces apiculatus]|uniref:Uncharacterized protein n=1 Tax=Chondromyces apiculatus DSM 436 TaxID=1192034 RepID=A0A017SWD8_9BACT|nr:hypothetical protein [Chondromyces apiculatus]EYF00930.1 Hypothetical protein CAP_8878 [Chondromyces apiculatus DSM 436]